MNIKTKKYIFFPLLGLSLFIHSALLFWQWSQNNVVFKPQDQHRFNIKNLRIVGEKTGLKEKLLFVKKKEKVKPRKQKPSLKNLSFRDLPLQPKNSKGKAPAKKLVKSLHINKDQIKDFLKSPGPSYMSPSQALSALSETDIHIKLEVPKGIPEDELNKHELVFYSFQKRTVLAYINSFQKELNSFERKNPHLQFPLTRDSQKMAGRVIYDKNGDILKIETLRWSRVQKLQVFFMDVLKNMTSLPNPPREILKNEKFAINFVLTIND